MQQQPKTIIIFLVVVFRTFTSTTVLKNIFDKICMLNFNFALKIASFSLIQLKVQNYLPFN